MHLMHNRCEIAVNPNPRRKVVLLAVDGLDWDIIQLYCDNGHLPHFSKLFEQSAAGIMPAPVQTSASLVWTTAMSGVSEEMHGILSDLEYGPGGLSGQAVSQLSLRVPRVWEYADAQGLVSHVLGWPATLPANINNGIMVANGVQHLDAGVKDVWPLHPESVYPKTWREQVLDYRIIADDISPAYVNDLLRFIKPALAEKLKVPSTLLLAQILSMHSLGIQMADDQNWQFLALRFDTLPLVYGLPFQITFDESPLSYFLGWYKLIDAMLGKYMSYLADSDYLMLLSERGVPQVLTGKPESIFTQQGPGALFIKGPDILRDSALPEVAMLDICPTLFTMLGLQPHDQLAGQSLYQSKEALFPLNVPDTWPSADIDISAVMPPQKTIVKANVLAKDADIPEADFSGLYKIRDQVCVQQLYALAYAFRQKGSLEGSKQALQALINIDPNHIPALIMLARTLLELNELKECRLLVEQYQHLKSGPVWTNLIDGMLALGGHQYEQAARCFEILLSCENVPINVSLWYADALIKLKRYQDAKVQLKKAVKQGTEILQAWQKLSYVEMQLGQFDDALNACNQAVALQPSNPYLLINRFELKVYLGSAVSAKKDLLRALKLKSDIISQEQLNKIVLKQPSSSLMELYNIAGNN